MTREELISLSISTGNPIWLYMIEPVLFPYGEWVKIEPTKLKRGYDYTLMDSKTGDLFINKVRRPMPVANPHGDDYHASEMLAA